MARKLGISLVSISINKLCTWTEILVMAAESEEILVSGFNAE
jgi:hypothetical protein